MRDLQEGYAGGYAMRKRCDMRDMRRATGNEAARGDGEIDRVGVRNLVEMMQYRFSSSRDSAV